MASDFSITTPEQFQRTYEEVKGKRLVATNVLLSGLERTKSDIIARELEPLQHARSLDEIKDVLLEVQENLEALNIFDAVEIIISDSNQVCDVDALLPRASTGQCVTFYMPLHVQGAAFERTRALV